MSRSLLEVLRTVSLDPSEHAAFSADPAGYLAQYGYEDVPPEDLAEAFSLVADTLPADVAQNVSSLGPEAADGGAGGLGGDGAALASDGFAAGPSLDADPAETTFGAVTNDFDDDTDGSLADGEGSDGDLDDLDDVADLADLADLGAGRGSAESDDGLGEPDDGGGFAFGEGSETLGAEYGDTVGATGDDVDLGFDDVGEPAGLGASDPGLEDADFGSGLDAAEPGTDATDDFGLDDGLDFGSSPDDDADIDDIGAF